MDAEEVVKISNRSWLSGYVGESSKSKDAFCRGQVYGAVSAFEGLQIITAIEAEALITLFQYDDPGVEADRILGIPPRGATFRP